MKINKQTFFSLLLIVLAIIIGLTSYLILKSSRNTTKPTQTPTASAKPEKVFDGKILSPTLDTTGQGLLYYNISDKKDLAFYRFDLTTKQEQKISENIDVPDGIIWSPNKDKIILKVIYDKYIFEKLNSPFKDNSLEDKQETTWLYDLNTKKLSRLNLNIQSIAWFDNDRIIYNLYESENNINAIFFASADGTNPEKIIDINYTEGVGLGLLSSEEIYYYPITFEFGGNNISKVNLKTKQTSELVGDNKAGQGMIVSGNKILYQIFNANDNTITLGLMNKDGSGKKDLGLNTTINKSVFSTKSDFIIAAVREPNQTTDTFYKINTENGQKEKIGYESQTDIDAKNLILDKANKTLYFTSDDILYSLNT